MLKLRSIQSLNQVPEGEPKPGPPTSDINGRLDCTSSHLEEVWKEFGGILPFCLFSYFRVRPHPPTHTHTHTHKPTSCRNRRRNLGSGPGATPACWRVSGGQDDTRDMPIPPMVTQLLLGLGQPWICSRQPGILLCFCFPSLQRYDWPLSDKKGGADQSDLVCPD